MGDMNDLKAQIAAVEKEIARINMCLLMSDADELYAARFVQKKKLAHLHKLVAATAADTGGRDV